MYVKCFEQSENTQQMLDMIENGQSVFERWEGIDSIMNDLKKRWANILNWGPHLTLKSIAAAAGGGGDCYTHTCIIEWWIM